MQLENYGNGTLHPKIKSNVIKNLTDADTKVIVFDIMFDAPDHTSKIIENHSVHMGT